MERININYRSSEIVLEKLEIRGTNQLYYKNTFEADKIKIKYDFRSLFTNLIKIDNLHISNTFFLEVDDKANSKIPLTVIKIQLKRLLIKINNQILALKVKKHLKSILI